MRRALIRLYPAKWRARYGAELEALMSDVTGGWRGNFDVLKGALGMQVRYQSGRGIVLGLVVAGMLVGWLTSYAVPQQWEAKAVMQITPAVISEPPSPADAQSVIEALRKYQANVLSRKTLATLIMDPRLDLYKSERRTDALEEIAAKMRANIHIHIEAAPAKTARFPARIFAISFVYPDPMKAVDTVNALITRFIQESANPNNGPRSAVPYLDTLDPPYILKNPTSPNRAALTIAGGIAGLLIAFIILVRRRASAPGPGLEAA